MGRLSDDSVTPSAGTSLALPSQTGNSGKVLSTDGTNPLWAAAAAGPALTPTATKTAAYTAAAGDLVLADAGTGNVPITLPASPAGGARVGVYRADSTALQANVVTITDGTFTDQVLPSQYGVWTWTGTAWTRPAQSEAALISPPVRVNNTDAYDKTGLYGPRSRIRYDNPARLASFYAVTDFDLTVNASVETTDPYHPNGSVRFQSTLTGAGGGYGIRLLANPIDLTKHFLRGMFRVDGVRTNLLTAAIDVSSDAFNSGNYHRYTLVSSGENNMFPQNTWDTASVGQADLAAVGSGATLTAINAVRFFITDQLTGSQYFHVAYLDAYPVTAAKAKCILWFDDAYLVHFTGIQPLLAQYNFRGVIAGMHNQGLTPEQMRRLEDLGWQIATHSFDGANHIAETGDTLRLNMSRARQAYAAMGIRGGDDMAYWGGIGPTQDVLRMIRSFFRSGRNFNNQSRLIDTLPPGSPARINAYGTIGADDTSGAAMIAAAQKAVAQNGLVQFVWHNQIATTGQKQLLAWLDANRATIDVVTLEEALAPYFDSKPPVALPSTHQTPPSAPSLFVTPASTTSMSLGWSIPTSSGLPVVSYTILRGTATGVLSPIASVPPAFINTYTDTGLTSATTYYYRVRASTLAGSTDSPEVSATTAAPARPGTAPASATAPATWMQADSVTPVASGTTVASVTDSSGNGKTWTSSGTPTYLPNAVGTAPAIKFTGTAVSMFSVVPLLSENVTVLMVVRANSNGITSYTHQRLFGGAGNTSGTAFGTSTGYSVVLTNTRQLRAGKQVQSTVPSPITTAPERTPLDVFSVIGVSIDTLANSHQTTLSVNGRTVTYTPSAYTTAAASASSLIGNSAQTNNGVDADIAEVVVFTTMLSDSDRRLWEQYLATRYGLAVQPA